MGSGSGVHDCRAVGAGSSIDLPVPDIRCPKVSVGTLVSVAQSQGSWVRGLICLRSVIHLLVGKARVQGGGRVS